MGLINKIILGGVVTIILALTGFLVSANIRNKKLQKENDSYVIDITDLKLEKTTEVKRVRDSATTKINTLVFDSQLKFDSLIYLNGKLKYRRYEKPIYIDRNLDDALDVLSKYKYNKGATEKD